MADEPKQPSFKAVAKGGSKVANNQNRGGAFEAEADDHAEISGNVNEAAARRPKEKKGGILRHPLFLRVAGAILAISVAAFGIWYRAHLAEQKAEKQKLEITTPAKP